MKITFSPDTKRRIQKPLDMASEEDLEAIRRRIAVSESEINRREFMEYDAENIEDLTKGVHAQGKEKLAERRKTSPRVGGTYAC